MQGRDRLGGGRADSRRAACTEIEQRESIMFERYIVLCDASRAEIYGLGHNIKHRRTWLVELGALKNPERRRRPSERFSTSRPGVQGANMRGPT
jgi:hypothetical protein